MRATIIAALTVGILSGLLSGVLGGLLASRDTQGDVDEVAAEVRALSGRIETLEIEKRALSVLIRGQREDFNDSKTVIGELIARSFAFYCTVDQHTDIGVCQRSIGDCVWLADEMRRVRQYPTPCWASISAFCTNEGEDETCGRDERSCETMRATRVLKGKNMSPCVEVVAGPPAKRGSPL
jgi:hypothetical protein